MAGNLTPNFTNAGNIGSVLVTAPNTSSQGGGTVGTDIFKAFTAGANGSFVDRVEFMPTATVAATLTTATTARIFLSTIASGATTSAETKLIGEASLAAATADHSTNPVYPIVFPVGYRIPANATILITNHVTPAANTAWRANVIASDY